MFAAGFFEPQGEWCAANHLEYQVHLNHEEMEMELTHSEGSFFRDMHWVEVPGIDAIWHQIWKDTISDYPRLASSVAHVDGKPRAFTESFAAYRPAPDVKMARYIVNEQFVRGVNLVEMMYFPATSAGPRPAPSYMGEPGFSDLTAYVRRMSYLMAMGRPDATVALYLPSMSMWLGNDNRTSSLCRPSGCSSEHQIDFDIVDEDALASGLKALPGVFETLSGNRYRTVILPAPLVLPAAAEMRLKAFARSGGKVVFLGGAPQWIAGRTIRNARAATAAEFPWANVVSAELPPTPTPPAEPPATPPAPQIVPAEVLVALQSAVIAPVIAMDAPDTTLRVMKRQLEGRRCISVLQRGRVLEPTRGDADGERARANGTQDGSVGSADGFCDAARCDVEWRPCGDSARSGALRDESDRGSLIGGWAGGDREAEESPIRGYRA